MGNNKQKIVLRYPQYQEAVNSYLALEEFKSLAAETIRGKRVTVTALCNYLGDDETYRLEDCTQADVVCFMGSIFNSSTSTKSGKSFILRHFFNYLYECGSTGYSGNELFPVIVTNKRDRILSFYSVKEVQRLIKCINTESPNGKRDLVIVLLAAALGMRSSDIARLELSDIHWERGTIEFTQYKTKVFNQLPLLENLKYAIIDYIRYSRPPCFSNLLFVGVKNDYGMLSSSRIYDIVSSYFSLAEIDISKRKHGPHALRHSLASSLLNANTPMHVIKDVLGHTDLNTTKTYLNIDFETLARFALEVPDED